MIDVTTLDAGTLARLARQRYTAEGEAARAEIVARAQRTVNAVKPQRHKEAARHVHIHSGNVNLADYTLIPARPEPGTMPREPWLRWRRAY